MLIAIAVIIPLQIVYAGNDVYDQIEKPVRKAIDIRRETQKAQTSWQEQSQRLLDDYEQLQLANEQLKMQRENLKKSVSAAKLRVAEKETQLKDIKKISVQIKPFLNELVISMHQMIEDDMPFLSDERCKRLNRLDQMLLEPDVAVSEKFRKIMEALMVEAEYGRTIEVYQETIETDGSKILVNIFRLGRIALFYQSLDGKESGFYNVALSAWEPLPESYNYTIQNAIDIGAKRRPVEMLNLPIGRITVK